jgi:hypothetical protein
MSDNTNFSHFLFRENRSLLIFSSITLILIFILIKRLYPNAIIAPDSNQLIRTAINNVELTAWPIGYPKFIQLVHFLVPKDWAIVFLQYILLQAAILHLFFTTNFFFRPRIWVSRLILFFLLFNPFILCISNYILADGLFATITAIWFTLTIWYFYQPRPVYAFLLIVTLLLAFSVRYYALFYPLITVPVIIFSKARLWVKIGSILFGFSLFFAFVLYTENLYKRLIGQREFSPFSGWQLASNALIMYRHIPDPEQDISPPALRPLHQFVIHALHKFPSPDLVHDRDLFVFFPWKAGSPLVSFSHAFYSIDPSTNDLQQWAAMGKLYHDYGMFLIKRHPLAYIRFYIGQGVDWFIDPKKELVNEYPKGGYWVTNRTRKWFGYKSNWVPCTTSNILTIAYFPIILSILNLLFVFCILGYYFYRGSQMVTDRVVNKTIFFAAAYWLANFLFIITSAPFVLRYGLSMMIVNLVFIPTILDRITKA